MHLALMVPKLQPFPRWPPLAHIPNEKFSTNRGVFLHWTVIVISFNLNLYNRQVLYVFFSVECQKNFSVTPATLTELRQLRLCPSGL